MAIVSLAVISVFNGMSRTIAMTAGADNRLVANWVASNALAEARLKTVDGQPALSSEMVDMGGRSWRYEMKSNDTSDSQLIKVDVMVYLENEDTPMTTIFGYLSRLQ